jgi:hypothetical protein
VCDTFRECRRNLHAGFGDGATLRQGLCANINHGGAPMCIKVR